MKFEKHLIRKYGDNGYGFADMPEKISGTTISRIAETEMGSTCSFCFPHGIETKNSRWYKMQRCWKKQREKQWKETR